MTPISNYILLSSPGNLYKLFNGPKVIDIMLKLKLVSKALTFFAVSTKVGRINQFSTMEY